MWMIVDATGYKLSDETYATRKEAEEALKSLRSFDREQWRGCYAKRTDAEGDTTGKMTWGGARKVMEQASEDAAFLADKGAAHRQRVQGEQQVAAFSLIGTVSDELAHMVAKLLQDAMRRQEIEPNAGTAARIAEARDLLATINGEG